MTIILGGDRTIEGQERVVLNLESYRGDTNKPLVITYDLGITGNPITAVAIALMHGQVEVQRFVTNANITINNYRQFTLNNYVVSAKGGEYKYDIQITLADGTVATPIFGTWKVREDQTKS